MLDQDFSREGFFEKFPDARSFPQIVIDKKHRGKNYGKDFMALIEKWLKLEGYKSIHTESSPAALGFYKRLNYKEMPFNDPDGYEGIPEDIAMGKLL